MKVVLAADSIAVENNPVQKEYELRLSLGSDVEKIVEFIHQHPHSVIAANALYDLLGRGSLSLEVVKKEYLALSPTSRQSPIGRVFFSEILKHNKIRETT